MKARSNLVSHLSGSILSHPNPLKLTAQTDRFGRMRVGRSTRPSNPNTAGQQEHRFHYLTCSTIWGLLSSEQKGEYSAEAKVRMLTNYNVFMSSCLQEQMYKQYYYYYGSGPGGRRCYDQKIAAIIWTVGEVGDNEDHFVMRIRTRGRRRGTAHMIQCAISTATDGAGPTGSDLTDGWVDGNEWSTGLGCAWKDIDVDGTILEAGHTYAAIFRYPDGDSTHYIEICHLNVHLPPYPNMFWYSDDDGGRWARLQLATPNLVDYGIKVG